MNAWKQLGWLVVVGLIPCLSGWPAAETPDFKEVYDLLRSNLAGTDEKALNRAAVEGLLKQLYPRVTLLKESDTAATHVPTGSANPVKATVLEGSFGWFRINQVEAGLGKELFDAYQKVVSTNRLKGLVLDLRFADGQDYGAALAAADCFFSNEQPLIDWGEGVKNSTAKENAIRLPVMVLVNARTAAAAEALAGILRQSDVALVVGAPTAGKASKFKEFPLKNGERLRLATSPVKVGKGESLPLTGLKPDILVEVSPEDEQAYREDAYKVLSKSNRLASATGSATNESTLAGTNRAARHLSEAELVRLHREGGIPDTELTNTPRRATETAKPVLQDPVLVRALDVLKGLAVLQPFRPRST